MSRIGYGYGSEWHLLRYLGYHRACLKKEIKALIGCDSVEWSDFNFDTSAEFLDAEIKGIEFLPEHHPARKAWTDYWPQRGNPPNWDAVGMIGIAGAGEWLLVEAKAHMGELESSCQAREQGGLPMIREALDQTKRAVGAAEETDWLQPYYQYANRLSVLNFLIRNDVKSRLLFIYFTGDSVPGKKCPTAVAEWQTEIEKVRSHLGLTGRSLIEDRVHSLVIPVCPAPSGPNNSS